VKGINVGSQTQRSKPQLRSLLLLALIGGVAALPEPAMAKKPHRNEACPSNCSSSQSCTFNGIRNIALGDAALSINDLCHMVVSGIGASGEDGFSQIFLPGVKGEVVTEFACPNFAESQPGATATFTVHADVPGGIFYRKTVENIGNGTLEIRPDFSPVGATLYTLTILDGDKVTAIFSDLPSATFSVPQGDQEEFN
jgi:hypothetical protein